MGALAGLEFAVLELLELANGPVGSGTLSCAMHGRDCSVSEPTFGRLLRKMDTLGLTVKVGKRGRLLTPSGRARLEELRGQRERADYEGHFLSAIKINTLEDALDVLVARRAIEREIARLAALRATAEDVAEIRRALARQEEHLARGEYGVEEDRQFHRALAKSARNLVLSSALDLIRHDRQMSALVIAIRQRTGSRMAVDHHRILDAIEAQDQDRAEQLMLNHLDDMIRELEVYRQQQQASPGERAPGEALLASE